jgi:plastocyanin
MSRLALFLQLLVAAANASAATVEAQVRDASGAPVADAVVYAAPASGAIDVKGARHVEIEQVEREFVPYVSVVQTGTLVTFPNRDPILHHVYSFSPAKAFEIKLYSGKSPSEILFDKPGVVTLGCNIHDWMIAYILVVSTPHFARSDAAGVARLRELPAGRYEIRAWHPQQRAALTPHELALDSTAAVRPAFVFDLIPRKAKYKPPLDRLKY